MFPACLHLEKRFNYKILRNHRATLASCSPTRYICCALLYLFHPLFSSILSPLPFHRWFTQLDEACCTLRWPKRRLERERKRERERRKEKRHKSIVWTSPSKHRCPTESNWKGSRIADRYFDIHVAFSIPRLLFQPRWLTFRPWDSDPARIGIREKHPRILAFVPSSRFH